MIASNKSLKVIGHYLIFIIGILTIISLVGCGQEQTSDKPPIHLVPNMDNQPRYEPQGQSEFFADGMNDRQPVEGTIARGQLITDYEYHTGRDKDSLWLKDAPLLVSHELLVRGQDRFNIYCSPCHGRLGDSKGAVSKRGMLPPPTFHSDSLRNMGDGYLFEVITKGKGNMPSYSFQVPVDDRWAIVKYIRALQRSQNASIADVPVDTTAIIPEDTALVVEESVTE